MAAKKAKAKLGRPPREVPRPHQVKVRLTDIQMAELETAAEMLGVSATECARLRVVGD